VIGPTDLLHPSPAPFQYLSRDFWCTFRSVKVSASYKAKLKMYRFAGFFLKCISYIATYLS
jgi:hypothetical protein